MFQNMVKSATFEVIWEALNAIDNELDGVQKRLKKLLQRVQEVETTLPRWLRSNR